jgi:electron transfer flavoprotein beta subunit
MQIVVILRLIPDMSEDIEINESGSDIDREWIGFKLNEFDDHALEEAVLLKERFGGKVTAVALAAEGVDKMLQSASARGADEVIRIDHDLPPTRDPRIVAPALTSLLDELRPDLILTGVQTSEDVFGQLGPMLAGALSIPSVNAVSGVSRSDGKTVVQQEYSGGLSAFFEIDGPAVLGIQAASSPPRYVSGTKLRQAMSTPIRSVRTAAASGAAPSSLSLSVPVRSSHAEMLTGDAETIATAVVKLLRDRGLVEA